MFDTMKVARKIREARIARNMTQMNLADAMEVSYQAVSNWERGNSMPDISKLDQLCQVLGIGMEELLGTDRSSKVLNRIINRENSEDTENEPVTIQDIQDVAPLLPPADVEKLVDDSLESRDDAEPLNLKAIAGLAPFLNDEYLDSLVKRAKVDSLKELAGLAPFLSDETLNSLVANADIEKDMSGIISLAPFLSDKALNELVRRMLPAESLKKFAGLAPFLSNETLDALIMGADLENDMRGVVSLAPFLGDEILNKVLEKLPENGRTDISGLYPFLSQKALQKLAESLAKGGGADALKSLKSILPFL